MGKLSAVILAAFLLATPGAMRAWAETPVNSSETDIREAAKEVNKPLSTRLAHWFASWFKKSGNTPAETEAPKALPEVRQPAAVEKKEEDRYAGLTRLEERTCGKQRGVYYSDDGTYGKPNAAYLREMSKNEHNELAREIAKKFDLDPDLFTALVFAESSGLNKEPDMKNPYDSFAQGLVQVSHAVMKDVHRWTNDKRFHVTCPKKWDETCNPRKNPAINLEAGARYLQWLQKRCKGDPLCTTLSYNIGPGTYDAVKAGRKPLSCEGELYSYKIIGIPGSKIRPGVKIRETGFSEENGPFFGGGVLQALIGANNMYCE